MKFSLFPNFIEVARLDEVPPGTGFRVLDQPVAVFNVAGRIFAIADTCPHAGGSLGMGRLEGSIVTCPMHGMKFDVATGCFAGTPDSGVDSYPVKVVDGKVMVGL
jgi:nitrite reductase/ring-hydroxylating ferredoxin subunit